MPFAHIVKITIKTYKTVETNGFDRRRRELSERRRLLEEDAALPMLGVAPAPAAAPRTARSLESLMDNLGESFTTRLLRLIDERGLKDSTVYKQSNISRRFEIKTDGV